MIRALRLFNGRVLLRRPLRSLMAAIAVASGIALTVMILVVSSSIERSIERESRNLAGPADVRVVGSISRGGVTMATARRLGDVPGVAAAVPIVRDVSWIGQPYNRVPVLVIGVPCDVGAIAGFSRCADGRGAAAVSPRVAKMLREDGQLRTHVGYIPLASAVSVPELSTFNDGMVTVLPIDTATDAFGRQGNVDAVLIVFSEGADRATVTASLTGEAGPGHRVEQASAPPAEAGDTDAFLPIFSLMAVFALGVGAVLAYNIITLTIEERRRQLAIASALGASPQLLAAGLVCEAGAVGLVGGGIGAIAGVLFAGPVISIVGAQTENVLGVHVTTFIPSGVIAIALLLGVLVAVAACVLPIRRVLRADVAAEIVQRDLRIESVPASRMRVGAVATAIALVGLIPLTLIRRQGALEPWQPIISIASFLTTALAAVLATAFLAAGVIALGARLVPRRFVLARVAARNLLRSPARTGVTVCAVSAAIAVALTTASSTETTRSGITRNITAGVGERVVMQAWAAGVFGVVAPKTVERVEALPGVARVDLARSVRAQTSAGAVRVVAFDHDTLPFRLYAGSKDQESFEAGAALTTPSLARRGIGVGDTITLRGPRGMVEVPVLGVWEDGTVAGDPVRVPMSTFLEAFGETSPSGVSVVPERGVGVDQLAIRLREEQLDVDAWPKTPTEEVDDVNESLAGQFAGFWAMQRALALIAAIAVLATTVLTLIQRRRELAMLVAVGMAPRDLARVLLLEAAAVGAAGAVLGPILGLVLLQDIHQLSPLIVGFHNQLVVQWSVLLVWMPTAVALVVGAAAWPALRATKLDVVESLRWE